VQKAVLSAFEEMTGQCSPGFAIDGCSAPNFATSLAGLARAMSRFATAVSRDDVLSRAAARLLDAMIACPDHVAGPGRAGTVLMRAAKEPVAVKSGAEGCYVAVLPRRGLGVAIKISDGAARASECAIAALLVHLGVLDRDAPEVLRFFAPPVLNWDGLVTGVMRPALSFPA
jgi:L-asparaginase II